VALSTRRRNRSYPSPITNFDDSNRERAIAQSQGIASLPSSIIPFRTSETPRENFIARTQGGNKDRDFNTSDALYRLFENYKKNPGQLGLLEEFEDRAEKFFGTPLETPYEAPPMERPILPIPFETPPMERPILPKNFVPEFNPVGLFGPGPGLGDPTGEGGIIQKFGEMLGLTPRIDPENEGLPMDEFQESPRELLRGDEITMDDTYTLPNLLQMLDDARDAGNEDEIELLTNDLEMMYPGATTTI
jgi:hypothetical protein